jgi:hypothetical protein
VFPAQTMSSFSREDLDDRRLASRLLGKALIRECSTAISPAASRPVNWTVLLRQVLVFREPDGVKGAPARAAWRRVRRP